MWLWWFSWIDYICSIPMDTGGKIAKNTCRSINHVLPNVKASKGFWWKEKTAQVQLESSIAKASGLFSLLIFKTKTPCPQELLFLRMTANCTSNWIEIQQNSTLRRWVILSNQSQRYWIKNSWRFCSISMMTPFMINVFQTRDLPSIFTWNLVLFYQQKNHV